MVNNENATDIIRVQRTAFNNVELIDCGVWWEDPSGEAKATTLRMQMTFTDTRSTLQDLGADGLAYESADCQPTLCSRLMLNS